MDKTRQERYNMIYGNTARKIEASTQPASTQPERKQRPRRKVQTTPQTKQNQKRVQSIDLAFIKVLVAGICVIAAMSFFYLSERAQFMKQKSVLSDSKTQLNTLQVENEDMNLEIEQSIKFDTIETAAANQMQAIFSVMRVRMLNIYGSMERYQMQTKRWLT